MLEIQVRPALPQDAATIAKLLGTLGYPATPDEVRDRLSTLDDSDCVLLTDGGLIAMHRVSRLAEGHPLARITALVVAPEHRARGIGRQLLRAAEDVARRWGCGVLEVASSRRPQRDAAHRFYPAHGFQDAGAQSVHYWKRLEPE